MSEGLSPGPGRPGPATARGEPGYGSLVRVSAKVDYALRAMLELAAEGGLVKGEQLATAQAIPQKFLEAILVDLRHAELVASRRGVDGGYSLAKPASEISVADVIRAVEGPIATVRGARPDDVVYNGAARALRPCGSSYARRCATCSRRRRWPTSSPAARATDCRLRPGAAVTRTSCGASA